MAIGGTGKTFSRAEPKQGEHEMSETLDEQKISQVNEIIGDRVTAWDPEIKGQWAIWQATKSDQTMAKFVSRLKKEGYNVFCRDRTFGIHLDSLK